MKKNLVVLALLVGVVKWADDIAIDGSPVSILDARPLR